MLSRYCRLCTLIFCSYFWKNYLQKFKMASGLIFLFNNCLIGKFYFRIENFLSVVFGSFQKTEM
jgi:hypothetical protein